MELEHPQILVSMGLRTHPLADTKRGPQSSQEEVNFPQLLTLKSLYQASKHLLPLLF